MTLSALETGLPVQRSHDTVFYNIKVLNWGIKVKSLMRMLSVTIRFENSSSWRVVLFGKNFFHSSFLVRKQLGIP